MPDQLNVHLLYAALFAPLAGALVAGLIIFILWDIWKTTIMSAVSFHIFPCSRSPCFRW